MEVSQWKYNSQCWNHYKIIKKCSSLLLIQCSFTNIFYEFANVCLRFICLRKLPFCVVRWGQKGHWNCGSFPHSCFKCWLSDGRCWYTLVQFGQLYGPVVRSLLICRGVTKLVNLRSDRDSGLENGVPKLEVMPITKIK
jgi:hypothetical protein